LIPLPLYNLLLREAKQTGVSRGDLLRRILVPPHWLGAHSRAHAVTLGMWRVFLLVSLKPVLRETEAEADW